MSILTTTDTTVLDVRAATLRDAASISARLDRLPATWSVWKLVIMLSLGSFFELYDLVLTGYVTPGLVKSGCDGYLELLYLTFLGTRQLHSGALLWSIPRHDLLRISCR